MRMRLTLVRHAEMAGDPFIEPTLPVSGCLTADVGIRQAEAAREALRGERFDAALSSPYGRALQTAQIVLEGRDLPIRILPCLREWQVHPQFRKLPDDEWEALCKESAPAYLEDGYSGPLGEGCLDMLARVVPSFLKALGDLGIHAKYGGFVPEPHAKDLSVIVFAHGGSLGTLLDFLMGRPIRPVTGFSFEHTGVASLRFAEVGGVHYPQLVVSAPSGPERS